MARLQPASSRAFIPQVFPVPEHSVRRPRRGRSLVGEFAHRTARCRGGFPDCPEKQPALEIPSYVKTAETKYSLGTSTQAKIDIQKIVM